MDRGGNMLDKRKIRLMIKMASYEKQGAEEDLKISSYYKKDYVSMNVWLRQSGLPSVMQS